ncbi:MAG: helix-turn-helix domain-containing protein [Bryobacterales bacterium]|nr:helix-turn-helix domain-containing protein [Bryobacterales bacterium]
MGVAYTRRNRVCAILACALVKIAQTTQATRQGAQPVKVRVENRLAQIRKSRGVGASDLARRVNVSRQTIHAIEAGTYVPNTEVALHLARHLEVSVDELFALKEDAAAGPELLSADMLSAEPAVPGQPVRVSQVGSRWVSVPVSALPFYMPEADGIVKSAGRAKGRAQMLVFANDGAARKRLVLAGCDPATGLLTSMVEKSSGVEVVAAGASSRLALHWMVEGKVHIAGSHLEDPKSGEFNLPFLRKQFPGEELTVVTFARWEEGFVVAPGNPKGIQKPEDLARRGTRIANREPGSGSRALLDRLLETAGVETARVFGYNKVAFGHLAAAYTVVTGEADACLATRSAAQAFHLDFVPLHSARYDLVMRRQTAQLPAVQAFLDVLQRAALRRKLEVLAGYDTSTTGAIVM